MKAELLFRSRLAFPDMSFAELVSWRVPVPVPPSSHNFKYRLAYVVNVQRVLGYDNERGKGDHRHRDGREEPFRFDSVEALVERFIAEIEEMRRGR